MTILTGAQQQRILNAFQGIKASDLFQVHDPHKHSRCFTKRRINFSQFKNNYEIILKLKEQEHYYLSDV